MTEAIGTRLGMLMPPVAMMTRAARTSFRSSPIVKPSLSRRIMRTRRGCAIATPRPRGFGHERGSAPCGRRRWWGKLAGFLTFESDDRSPRRRPLSRATSKRRSTLRIAGRVEPRKPSRRRHRGFTLQRPPPAIRIFAPSLRAPSRRRTDAPATSGAESPPSIRPRRLRSRRCLRPAPCARHLTMGRG